MANGGVTIQLLAHPLVAFFKRSNTVSWMGIESDLEISVMKVCHELDVIGEQFFVPAGYVNRQFKIGLKV